MSGYVVNTAEIVVPSYIAGITGGAAERDLAEQGATPSEIGSSAIQVKVVSTDTADALAGVNCRTVKVAYLDGSLALQVGSINMNGTTGQTSTFSDVLDVIGFWCDTFGTNKKNAGAITLQKSDDSFTIAKILAGDNLWYPGRYTVPVGKKAVFRGAKADSIARDWKVRLMADMDPDSGALVRETFWPYFAIGVARNYSEWPSMDGVGSGVEFPAGCTIKMVGSHSDGVTVYPIGGWMKLLLVDA